ncbi:PepSY domain-containing protein [Pseudomonas aeruginosa]|nr:PepSY domain-containing protein [Pseudomonas aeruginosa]
MHRAGRGGAARHRAYPQPGGQRGVPARQRLQPDVRGRTRLVSAHVPVGRAEPLYRQDRNHPPAQRPYPLQFVTESMRPLHTGDFGGIWVKLIWFVFGLLLSMMVLSGLLIWSKRTAQATAALVKRGKRPARQPKPAKPAPVMANQTAEGQP